MKALDKVFDTQVITGIIKDKFHFIEQKKISYMKKGRNRQERRYQSYTVTEEKSKQNLSKSKWMEHWTDVSSYKLYDSIDFENLTGKFGLKHQVIIILKSWV